MALEVTRVKPLKSYEYVVEQIESAICDGGLVPGERLPPEMKLKEMFDTSRGTVREALRVLEQKGLVSIRTGVKGGARVKAASTEAMSDSMALLIRHKKVSLDHLAGFRELLEGDAARHAARNGDPDSLSRLDRVMEEIRTLAQGAPDNWEGFNRLDAEFHLILARMGGNPLVEANLSTIHENIHTYFQQYLPFSRELLEQDVADLERIRAAVAEADPDEAERLARGHVARFTILMADHLDKAPGGEP